MEELSLRTGKNGHNKYHGVFFHAGVDGAAFYVDSPRPQWPQEPMCFLELACTSMKKVKGGMAQRYCATGQPGTINRKVQLVALWVWCEDIQGPAPPPPPLPPPPSVPEKAPKLVLVPREVPKPVCLDAGLTVITNWDYTANGKCETRDCQEVGYLKFAANTELVVMSPPYPGHAGNFYSEYVFVEMRQSTLCGWVPTLLLHQPGCGDVAILHKLQSRPNLNGIVVDIQRMQGDRFLVQHGAQRIAVKMII